MCMMPLLVQGDELHYIGWQRPDGARLMAVDFAGDGLREVKKFGSWQPATDRSEDVQLFTARKRTLYVQLGNKVLGMMPGRDAAEVLTYNSLPYGLRRKPPAGCCCTPTIRIITISRMAP